MSENKILFNEKVFALYSQVALFDAEAEDAYPEWITGKEAIVYGLRGVAVATATDQKIDVQVCTGNLEIQYTLCVSGEILIGKQGILVGNVPAAALTHLSLPAGKYSIIIYTDGIGSETHQVYYCLDRLGS